MLAQRSPRSGNTPKQLALLLHGWGADGANLIDLADMLAESLPDAHFIAPNAPDICEVNPFGYQWFSLNDRSPEAMSAGVTHATKWLNSFIDGQLKILRGEGVLLPSLPVLLIGFSQGTMLSLHVALRRADVGAVAGFSGALLAGDALSAEISHRPPVCLIHGQMDDVVPYAAMGYAERALAACGVPVQSHTRPGLGHSIDMEGIAIAGKFLKSVVA